MSAQMQYRQSPNSRLLRRKKRSVGHTCGTSFRRRTVYIRITRIRCNIFFRMPDALCFLPKRSYIRRQYKLGGNAFSAKLSPERLRDIFFRLIDEGAHNINLVTPTHFTDLIIKALRGGLPVPVIWNCGGYENIETLRKLDGIVDVYLPDFKYSSPLLAEEYSSACNYPEIAEAAVQEMINQSKGNVLPIKTESS